MALKAWLYTIVRNRAHFYFTLEKDHEDIAGQKRFPAAAAPHDPKVAVACQV